MKTKISLLFAILLLLGCQQDQQTTASVSNEGMIKVTILYPNGEGKTFDMDYYANSHMPMVKSLLGDSLKMYAIDKGIAGGAADAPLPYLAIGYLYFDKLSAYQNSIAPHIEQIRGDVSNYTNIVPVIQISEVLQ